MEITGWLYGRMIRPNGAATFASTSPVLKTRSFHRRAVVNCRWSPGVPRCFESSSYLTPGAPAFLSEPGRSACRESGTSATFAGKRLQRLPCALTVFRPARA